MQSSNIMKIQGVSEKVDLFVFVPVVKKMHESRCRRWWSDVRFWSEKVGKGRKSYSKLTEPINLYILKCQCHMFLPVVFVFQSVVLVLEEDIDLLQQHMVIW